MTLEEDNAAPVAELVDATPEALVRARMTILTLAHLDRPCAERVLASFKVKSVADAKEGDLGPIADMAEREIARIEGAYTAKPSLRDQMAIAALQGPVTAWNWGSAPNDRVPCEEWAERAYAIADAMLLRRQK